MPTIDIIENPRRRRRKRRSGYTAKQLAAGFGGKSRMRSTPSRRRRNPGLIEYMANPRRRRRGRRRTAGAHRRHRYSNPKLGNFLGINMTFALSAAAGIAAGRIMPSMIQKVWPTVPVDGFAGKAIRIGSVIALSYGIRKFLKMPQVASGLIAGEAAYELYLLLNEYVLPKIGLAGLGEDSGYLTMNDIDQLNLAGYVTQSDRLSGYEPLNEVLAA